MRFDTLIMRGRQLPDADKLLIVLVDRGIDIVCVAGECTADPGFLVQRRAAELGYPVRIIPGAVVLGSDNLHLLVVGAVDRVTIPARNDTAPLTHLVRAKGGATIALHPSLLVDTPDWTLLEGSMVWYEHALWRRTVPVTLAATGYGGLEEIGRAYTDVDCPGDIKTYTDLTRLMVTNPEKFVPVILKGAA